MGVRPRRTVAAAGAKPNNSDLIVIGFGRITATARLAPVYSKTNVKGRGSHGPYVVPTVSRVIPSFLRLCLRRGRAVPTGVEWTKWN